MNIEKIIHVKFDKFWLRLVEEVAFFGNRIFGKISATDDPKMTLNATRPKGPYIC